MTTTETISTKQDVIDSYARSMTNHAPSPTAVTYIEHVRADAKQLLAGIVLNCPPSRERSLALTHLEETVMWAVKSIVLGDTSEAAA